MVFTNGAILVYFKEEENETLEDHVTKAAGGGGGGGRIKAIALEERNKNLGFVRNNVPIPNTFKAINIRMRTNFLGFLQAQGIYSLSHFLIWHFLSSSTKSSKRSLNGKKRIINECQKNSFPASQPNHKYPKM